MKFAEQLDRQVCSQAIIRCVLICFLTFLQLRGKGDGEGGWMECCALSCYSLIQAVTPELFYSPEWEYVPRTVPFIIIRVHFPPNNTNKKCEDIFGYLGYKMIKGSSLNCKCLAPLRDRQPCKQMRCGGEKVCVPLSDKNYFHLWPFIQQTALTPGAGDLVSRITVCINLGNSFL